jgi:uncharacterized protein (TIGR02145 family)
MKNLILAGFMMLIFSRVSCNAQAEKKPTVYTTVTIGTQVWMAENLKTTNYRNGDAIPNVTDNTLWGNRTTGSYCNYNNDAINSTTYGRLYNWYAVNDSRNIAPAGWHVPTDAEWTTLTGYLTNNGYGYQGSGIDIAKSMASTSGWSTYSAAGSVGNDQASNNRSGFTALPGGYRYGDGSFSNIGYSNSWWSSTMSNTLGAWYRSMYYSTGDVSRSDYSKGSGFSVRCIRD